MILQGPAGISELPTAEVSVPLGPVPWTAIIPFSSFVAYIYAMPDACPPFGSHAISSDMEPVLIECKYRLGILPSGAGYPKAILSNRIEPSRLPAAPPKGQDDMIQTEDCGNNTAYTRLEAGGKGLL